MTTEIVNPKDLLGREINVGDIVAYPVRRRSDMVLKTATVSELCPLACLNATSRRVVLKHPSRCVIVSPLKSVL